MASGSQAPTPIASQPAPALNHPKTIVAEISASGRSGSSPSTAATTVGSYPPREGKRNDYPTFQVPVFTGAAAIAEKRALAQAGPFHRPPTSPNPAMSAVKSLMPGPIQSMSKPSDAPNSASAVSGTSSASVPDITAEPMQIDQNRSDRDNVTDPRLTESDANNAQSTLATSEGREERANKAFTYPPRPDQIQDTERPNRSMTLPNSSIKSPGSKKHKCDHCGTEFTRHHNLKSHLLTHSQEKPFNCSRCDQKFRRLHDLKRHSKLHTGERPHTCPKCGRAFARGDALARHSKGPGGCAGRRNSGGEDEMDGDDGEEGMDGVVHDDNGDPSAKRRKSEQTQRRERSLADAELSPPKQQSMTYPGIAPMVNSQQHLSANGPSSNTHLSPRMTGGVSRFAPQMGAPQSVFAQGGMTESPRPLSPGQEQARRLSAGLPIPGRNRSPSLAQHQLSRNSMVGSPAAIALPGTASQTALPPLGSIASDKTSSSIASSSTASGSRSVKPPTIATGQVFAQPGPSSASSTNPPSATSQTRSSGGSMREILNPGPSEDRAGDYIPRSEFELQMRRLEERFGSRIQQYETAMQKLQEENRQLRLAMHGRSSYPPMTQPESIPTTQ